MRKFQISNFKFQISNASLIGLFTAAQTLISLIPPISLIPSQAGFIKFTKRALVSYLIISIVFFGTGLIYLFNPFGTSSVDAAWFNDNWAYRKEVPITANAAADTDAFFSFTLDTATLITAGQLQSACQDIRVTDVKGNLLQYHVGRTNACNNAATTIDALPPYASNSSTPTLPAGTSTFYVYYGNPSVISADRGSNFTQSEAASYTVGTLGSAISAPSPTLYWKFDDAQGTNADDATTNALDGTLNNTPTWQAENFCIAAKCLYFDGANNENVSKSDDSKLDFVAADNFTLQAWVKRNGASSANNFIITKAQSGYTGYKVYMDASGDLCFDVSDGTNTDSACTSAVDFDDNQWHFVSAVKAATTSITLYVDGKQRAQDASIAATGTLANTGTFYTGVDLDGISNEWLGFIDEVKVTRDQSTRTASQVLADYNARSNPEGVASQAGNNTQNMPAALSNGLVGYWKLDEASGNASDSSGNSLTLTNNGITTYVSGKFANGSEHVPASSQYLSTATTIAGVKSVSFWVNPDSNTNYYLQLTSGAYITSSSGTLSATGFTSPTIYVNGVQTSTIAADAWQLITVTSDTAINADQFYVGRQGSNYFDGTLDEIRTYNRALSSSEVSNLYNWAPGPVVYLKMDEKTGTTAYDSSGNGLNGTITNSPTNIPGKYDGSHQFSGNNSGSNQYINISSGSDLIDIDRFTINAWVNPQSFADYNQIIDSQSGLGSQNDQYHLYLKANAEFAAYMGGECASGSSAVLTAGSWSYLTVSYNGSTVNLYQNGALVNSCSLTKTAGNSDNIVIGARSASSLQANAKIDDVKIYNYSRTQAQIIEDMNAGHPAPGSPISSAVAHWKLDEGYGTSANDYSGNSNTLTLSTATSSWTNNGKYLKAFSGAGTRWMSKSDDSDFDIAASDSFAISMWYHSDSATNPASTEYLLAKGPLSAAGYAIYANTDGTLCFGIDDDATWNPDVSSCTATDFYDGNWHHITGVRNTVADTISIYIDGQQKDSDTDTTSATLANSSSLYIADLDGTDNGSEFVGSVDEIKFYRSALTTSQVGLDMNRSSSEVLGALSDSSTAGNDNASTRTAQSSASQYCIPGDSSTCTGPVGEWKFDEGSGTTANDSTGNANTGTITAGNGGYVNGKFNKGYNFDGASTVAFEGSGSTLDNLPAAGMTVEAWIYPTGAGEGNAGFIVAKNNGSSQSAGWLLLTLNTGGPTRALQFVVDGATDLVKTTANNVYSYNTWNHITLTSDSDFLADSVHIYVNGREVTYTDSLGGSSRVSDAASSFYIGNASSGDRTFAGIIDQVIVYNYERTPAQVAWSYNQGKPIARWKIDECQGTVINDMSGNSYTGTLTNATAGTCQTSGAWFNGVAGKRNYSVDLDTDDYIQVSDTTNLRFDDATADFSLFAWIKRASNGEMNVISKEDADNDGYRLQFTSGNVVRCSVDTIDIDSTLTITDTNWHLVGCTIDRDGNGQVYLDGMANGTATAISSEVMANTANLRLGARAYTTANYLDGLIDDTKIYNYALTANQVKSLFNDGTTRYGPLTGAP